MKKKFCGDVDALNDTYGTTFWSQEYNDFDEIPTPMATITTHNPALRLDWERFRSESIVRFAEFQANLIRELAPNAVVMHDFSGGGLADEDLDEMMRGIQEAYWIAKEKNKKYTPKKYRKNQ